MGVINKPVLSITLFLFLLTIVGAEVPADYAYPQIAEKPLIVVPGEPVTVELYNGGHEVWTDLSVVVAETGMTWYRDLLEPESLGTVEVDVPFAYLLDNDALQVSLYYQGELLESRSLPVALQWPKQSLFVDPHGPSGPEFIVLVDANQFAAVPQGIQVEAALLENDEVTYFDFYGPFYLSADERLVWRTPVPERYMQRGDFMVRGTFYEGQRFLAETTSSFHYGKESLCSMGPLLIVVLSLVLLALIYVIVDMAFYKRSLPDSLLRFKE
ncbi:hypothetical protein GF367_04760 [Candidatus Woesearchaeota archaeon]|nr:hypothetical protein [Candidatus Woesearchaeota archaeon]